ncbi:MAG: EpsI family protein [Candidatus Omnitrophota bacterium]|nr:MAG: EpsI family protein [Candidatus Omnitrophota bacterium]
MARKIDTLTISCIILFIACVLALGVNAFKKIEIKDAPKPILPQEIGDFVLINQVNLPETLIKSLQTKAASVGEYEDNSGEEIQLYVLSSAGQRSIIHQPEYCYLGSGKNELLKKGVLNIAINNHKFEQVNYFLIQIEQGFQVVLYFYTVNHLITNSYAKQQIYFLIERLKNQQVIGSLVRVSKLFKHKDSQGELDFMRPILKNIIENRYFNQTN